MWHKEHTTGSPPGVDCCGFTVVGRRVVVCGGHCGHGDCYHNSLHELDSAILKWKELAPSEAEGPPIKKCRCGVVAKIWEERLVMFGGYSSVSDPWRMNYIYTLILTTLVSPSLSLSLSHSLSLSLSFSLSLFSLFPIVYLYVYLCKGEGGKEKECKGEGGKEQGGHHIAQSNTDDHFFLLAAAVFCYRLPH